MGKTTVIHSDAKDFKGSFDLIMTDPPFDLSGEELYKILENYNAKHLILITTMRQLLEFSKINNYWDLCFDFVLNVGSPKKSMSIYQPHYTHCTGVYFKKIGEKSAFDRKKAIRKDVYSNNYYYPTIFDSPKERSQELGYAKSIDAFSNILANFNANSVIDPFAGSGTTGLVCRELNIPCTLIERNSKNIQLIKNTFKFFDFKIGDVNDHT